MNLQRNPRSARRTPGAKEGRGWRFWFLQRRLHAHGPTGLPAPTPQGDRSELQGFVAGKEIPTEFAQHARRPEVPTRYYTSAPNEFRILDYVQVRRQVGRNFVARCHPARTLAGTGAATISPSRWRSQEVHLLAGCSKEMIRKRSAGNHAKEVRMKNTVTCRG